MTRAAILLTTGCLLLSAGTVSAQTNFSGKWALDREISADPSKATFEAPKVQARRTRGFSGTFGGATFGSGGRAGMDLPVEERTKLKELADYVKGFRSLEIEHSDHSTFTVVDAGGGSRLFPTDGSKTPITLASTTIDSATKWDGPHMVTVFTIGPARVLVFTYVLVPATSQMALRIQLEESGRPRADVPELRFVYKQTH